MTSRAPRKAQTTCTECDKPFYAKQMCKSHYMATFRGTFGKTPPVRKTYEPEDLEDFWAFVKKELNIV